MPYGRAPEAKPPLQFIQRDRTLAPFQRGDTDRIILAILQVLTDSFASIVALAPSGLFGEGRQLFVEIGL
jgi:hypothetical protein